MPQQKQRGNIDGASDRQLGCEHKRIADSLSGLERNQALESEPDRHGHE
jgi:hypothetical protein